MGAREDATARTISELDQRSALLRDVRAIAERNTTALVDAIAKGIAQANEETFGEAVREVEDELQSVLRAERKAKGE